MHTRERTRAPSGTTSSQTRAARRRALQKRRHRTMLVGATLIAAVALGAWFPASDLLHQHQQLAAATTELHHLDQKNHALEEKAAQLKTPAAIGRIAQQQYDLVAPGEQAYQVLPASGSGNGSVIGGTGTTGTGSSSGVGSGHRGSTGGSRTATGTKAGAAAQPTSGGFVSRVLQTLEFWR